MSHPFFRRPHPMVLGHRGAAGAAPENTLISFERALIDGAHVLESDIQVSADGIPILLHDARVDRTTDGQGESAQMSLAEIQRLDASVHFSPAAGVQAAEPDGPVRIPTLREAFEALPDAAFNLEIKGKSPELVSSVVDLVRDFGREERTLLTAGDDVIQARLRNELHRTGAQPAIGASVADVLNVVESAQGDKAPTTDSMALQIPRDFGANALVTRPLIEHCHEHGIEIHVWTINEVDEMNELLDLGVDGLVTDLPERLTQLIAARP